MTSTGSRRVIVQRHLGEVPTDTLDIAAGAWVEVTSEQELFPVDRLFDGRSGPGGSCWVAAAPGLQTIRLRFRSPTDLASLIVESEERAISSSQRIAITGRSEHHGGAFELAPRVLHYSPYEAGFHRETWLLAERAVTEVSLHVEPAPARRLASLTAIIFR